MLSSSITMFHSQQTVKAVNQPYSIDGKNHMPAFCGDLEVLKYARMMLDARRLHSADRPRAIPKFLDGIRHEPFAECPCANDAYSGCARPWGTSSFKYPVV